MIDTHSHIFSEEFNDDLPEVIARAREVGVTHIFMPNIDDTSVGACSVCAVSIPATASLCSDSTPHRWTARPLYIRLGK
jgi:TatD DNase family protein